MVRKKVGCARFMQYDFSRSMTGDGRKFEGYPFRIFDANNLQWHRVVWCDTETGELEHVVLDEDKRPKFNESRTEILRNRLKTAAPLTILPPPRIID